MKKLATHVGAVVLAIAGTLGAVRASAPAPHYKAVELDEVCIAADGSGRVAVTRDDGVKLEIALPPGKLHSLRPMTLKDGAKVAPQVPTRVTLYALGLVHELGIVLADRVAAGKIEDQPK